MLAVHFTKPAMNSNSFCHVTHQCFVFFRGSDGSSSTPSLKKNASVSSDMSDLASQCSGNSGEHFFRSFIFSFFLFSYLDVIYVQSLV